MVAFEHEGRRTPEATLKLIKRVVTGGLAIGMRDGETSSETTIEPGPTQEPKAIGVSPDRGPCRGQRAPGISKRDGDALTICMADPGRKRPPRIAVEEGSGPMLMILSRGEL